MKLSIIVPCYNESKNLPLILERFNEAIGTRKDIELVLVNNGSYDDSQSIMESLLPKYPFAKIAIVAVNQGYGFGILTGLKAAKGDFLAWTHADMQTDPKDVIKALEIAEKGNNPEKIFVKGNRRGRSFSENVFTAGMSIFESLYLGADLRDINAQPNLFHKSFYESWKNPPYDFSLDLYTFFMARKNKLEVLRFPVIFPKRIHGHSHWNFGIASKIKFIMRTLSYSFKLKGSLKQ